MKVKKVEIGDLIYSLNYSQPRLGIVVPAEPNDHENWRDMVCIFWFDCQSTGMNRYPDDIFLVKLRNNIFSLGI